MTSSVLVLGRLDREADRHIARAVEYLKQLATRQATKLALGTPPRVASSIRL